MLDCHELVPLTEASGRLNVIPPFAKVCFDDETLDMFCKVLGTYGQMFFARGPRQQYSAVTK